MIEIGLPPTNDEQNERNEQKPKGGFSGGICSSNSFCSSFVSRKPIGDPTPAENTALLDEWRRGLDRMRGHSAPAGWSELIWRQFKLDAFALLAEHGRPAAALGWRTEELFGLHREHAAVRVAASGLARFMHGGVVVEINQQLARIRHQSGSVLTYRRTEPQPDLPAHRTTARRRAGVGTPSPRRR
jgi:hypothetical protein